MLLNSSPGHLSMERGPGSADLSVSITLASLFSVCTHKVVLAKNPAGIVHTLTLGLWCFLLL